MTTLPHPPSAELPARISSIDALRGIAALAVVLYHAREIFWIGLAENYQRHGWSPDFNSWLGYLSAPFSYGSLGVTLFFVLSGYCIHRRGARRLARNSTAAFDFPGFAVRRFWRIYPTYVAALLLTALIDWIILSRPGFAIHGQDDSIFAFGISLLTLQGYFAPFFGSNGVFWTLAMEVHLYLAYPILFFISRRAGASRAVLFALAVGLAYLAANAIFGIEQHLPYRFQRGPVFLPYWFTWAAGFYLAEIEAGRAKDLGAWWKMAAVAGVGGGLLLGFRHLDVLADMFWALFFAGLLRWSLAPAGGRFFGGWLGTALASVGVFSYSLYAIHGPVLRWCYFAMAPSPEFKFDSILPAFGAAGIAVAAAWCFFQVVERWSLRPPAPRVTTATERLCHG